VALKRVCDVLGAARSTIYARRRAARENLALRPGPVGAIDDETLAVKIRQVIGESPFTGEGSSLRSGPGGVARRDPTTQRSCPTLRT
jgi:hypothetical protein